VKELKTQVIQEQSLENVQKVILPSQGTFVAGSLPDFQDNWEAISRDPVTLDAVTGFTIPFATLPPCRLPTHEELTAADNDVVVDESIKEILELKAAIVVPPDSPGFYSRVFTVPKMERGVEYGKRFIINLKVSCLIYWTMILKSPLCLTGLISF
jgi:hypothetical protein